MSRLEAIVSSPLSFRRNMSEGAGQYSDPAETVAITFDGRQFVWHAFDDTNDPLFDPHGIGPTVTSMLGDDTEETVATELERFLSALTFLYDVPAEVTHYGSSWTDDPFAKPHTRGPRAPGWARKPPLESISLRRDSEGVLKALGWYREGKNAGSPYYRFVAHWNALEAVFFGSKSRNRRAEFLDRVTPTLRDAWRAYDLPDKPSEHFQNVSRDAIGHVFRGEAGDKQLIDPDADGDRRRLDWESRFLEILVLHAIREVYGEPVSVVA